MKSVVGMSSEGTSFSPPPPPPPGLRGMPTVLAAYAAFKLVAVVAVWLANYVAEAYMSEKFVRHVYLNKERPPGLWSMVAVGTTTAVALVASAATMLGVALYVLGAPHDALATFAVMALADCVAWVALVAPALAVVVAQLSSARYFNYELEGLRAIRAARQISGWWGLICGVAPFALFSNPAALGRSVADAMQARQARAPMSS